MFVFKFFVYVYSPIFDDHSLLAAERAALKTSDLYRIRNYLGLSVRHKIASLPLARKWSVEDFPQL